ncbi:Monooxygenase 3-like protein [Drosera capensis]
MESVVDILIVGAGVSGLTTALALHKLGFRSLVLESSDNLRESGFHLSVWTNAWKAFDEIGIGDSLRQQHVQITGMASSSMISGLPTSQMSLSGKSSNGYHEVRRVLRKNLLGALEKELPSGTIRYSSKVVSIEESGYFKGVHLADGFILKAKVLIGCDGVNSVVGKWLGFKKPALDGRCEIKGYASFKEGHGLGPDFQHFFGKGATCGVIPSDDKNVYWFFTYNLSIQDRDLGDDPATMKEFVMKTIGEVPGQIMNIIENTKLEDIARYQLNFRPPWEVLWGSICKDNVCIAGDALHPMTPDIGQGGGSAAEDGITLARCLAEALTKNSVEIGSLSVEEEYERIKIGLHNYARERRWRGFELISTSYMIGWIANADWKLMTVLRDKVLAPYLLGLKLKKADFDCGKLIT